ncbi:MAG: M15 family metallopeptidase [Myxococcota bacterium]|jgi:hypothetical protein|nr:M15 family metallopeptidase [Myxococcota bacterium]
MRPVKLIAACSMLVSLSAQAQTPPRPEATRCFLESYPGILCGFEDNELRFCDGARLLWDDGATKTHARMLESADLEDTLSQAYPTVPLSGVLPLDFEPGRIRNQAFLETVYRGSELALKAIAWPGSGRKLRVTTIAGVADELAKVAQGVTRLPASIRRAVAKIGGGYHPRVIAGTTRKSPHSYGIAVDVAMERAEYWRWRLLPTGLPRPMKGGVPPQVVELFEQHGFIWGGKWYRYDTMHFEYRPELLHPMCRCGPPDSCYPSFTQTFMTAENENDPGAQRVCLVKAWSEASRVADGGIF